MTDILDTKQEQQEIEHLTDPPVARALFGQVLDAPDIRWPALAAMAAQEEGLPPGQASYDLATLRMAIAQGRHPDGDSLSSNMPRWKMSDQDLSDLVGYLQSLP